MSDSLIEKFAYVAGKSLDFLVRAICHSGTANWGNSINPFEICAKEDHVAAIALADVHANKSYEGVLQYIEAIYSEYGVRIIPDDYSENPDFPNHFTIFVNENLVGVIYNDPKHAKSTTAPITNSGRVNQTVVNQAARFLYDLRYQVHFNTRYTMGDINL